MDSDALSALLGADPLPWILSSDEPFARWTALTAIRHRASDDSEVASAHAQVIADERVQSLLGALPRWGEDDFPGHHSPLFLPNRLNLLADMGVGAGDEQRVEALLEQMLAHQDRHGHFQSLGKAPGRPKPEWGSLLCDTHAIADVLLRFGRRGDDRLSRALERMRTELATTSQGDAWQCVPDARTLFRGPGRKADVCPQVTLEALRAFSQLPEEREPWLLNAARTPLEVWRRRAEERPYQFGHGYQFKSVKWPNFWYDVLWVVETVGRFPELWRAPSAHAEDRQAVAELAACLIAYNLDEHGRVVPRRAYKGFESFSFGLKRDPSPFATARVLAALSRVADLAEEIRAVDVESLPGSKGGSGTPVPPPRRLIRLPEPPTACPVPRGTPTYPWEGAFPRALSRHHLQTRWDNATTDSVVADVAAVHAAHPLAPYASLQARLPGFAAAELDRALYERRSLVLYRCMRGQLFVMRTDFLAAVHAASNTAVVRAATKHAHWRGVDEGTFSALSPRILDLARERPVSTEEIRAELKPSADVAATVTLMLAKGLLLRDRPVDGWLDRARRFVPLDSAIPEVRLDAMSETAGQLILVRAYIRAFGPVRIRDIAWWTGVGPRRVQEAIRTMGDEIVEVALEGAPSDDSYFMHAGDIDELDTARTEPDTTSLLPSMDTFTMGYADKGRFVAPEHLRFVFDRAGNATSVIIVSGRVAGVWDIVSKPTPSVLVHLFEGVSASEKSAVEQRVLEMGRLRFGEAVPVQWIQSMVPLSDRPHGFAVKPLR
ncbi:MAG: hypothetical protein CVT67_04015 [Actinobacteria bacterium HGW-Actinobacteria-7]|jgi:hypothetical protein|nr:MAG: hypothetical protein CVT67_04015 [Actinobacteria bacterium HGW-Actinobacteria-7]